MTKQEAIKSMTEGNKVTHHYFSDGEWMTISGNRIITEEGYRHPFMEFWSYRQADGWNDGYELFTPSPINQIER